MTYSKERSIFKIQKVNWYFYIVGWRKTGPAHSFPPSKMFGSFYLSSRLLDYVILLLYLNSLDFYQAENQVFIPTSLFVIVGWGKTGPAQSFPPPKCSYRSIYLFSLLDYATLWMYLNTFEWHIPKGELSFLTYKFIGTSTLWGGERLGRPILSPLQNVSIFQFIV